MDKVIATIEVPYIPGEMKTLNRVLKGLNNVLNDGEIIKVINGKEYLFEKRGEYLHTYNG